VGGWEAEQPAMTHGDGAEPLEVLRRLDAYLAESDAEAADYLVSHANALRAMLGADRFADIRRAVESYDFETALERIRSAAGAGMDLKKGAPS